MVFGGFGQSGHHALSPVEAIVSTGSTTAMTLPHNMEVLPARETGQKKGFAIQIHAQVGH